MSKQYGKLVRDRVPEIIATEGRTCATEKMSDDEYRTALLAKVVEEAQEISNAPADKLIVEIADLLEVLDALMEINGFQPDDVRGVQQQRREERGGFSKQIKLLWTD